MAKYTKISLIINVLIHIQLAFSAETFIATECFGSVLSLSCKRGHRIKVLDDFFGLNVDRDGPDGCQYVPGDCTVTNNRYTSVIHRYCEGKQTCTSFQVDRSTCGTNQTNYEQVEYECVPDEDVLDICTPSSFKTSNGYIATPNFPNEYPPNLHCGCSMESLSKDSEIQLDFTHFIVKYDYPCKDWVELELAGQKRRLCGAYRSTLLTRDFNLTFHSDEKQGHQGLWLHFSVFPRDSSGQIKVECGPKRWTTTTDPPTTTTPQPEMTTTSELIILYEKAASEPTTTTRRYTTADYLPGVPLSTAPPPTSTAPPSTTDETLPPTEATTPSTTTTTEEPDSGKDLGAAGSRGVENEVGSRAGSTVAAVAPVVTRTKVELAPGIRNRLIPWFPGKPTRPITYIRTTKPRFNTIPPTREPERQITTTSYTTQQYTTLSSTQPTLPPTEPPQTSTTQSVTMVPEEILNEEAYADAVLEDLNEADVIFSEQLNDTTVGNITAEDGEVLYEEPSTIQTEDDLLSNTDPRLLDELRRRTNRTTGIIIISICVGGIVLLVIILGVLLCVNKQRKPTPVQQERNKKDKIQQRLNSLSFYDSIPMFDSVGRKAGMGLTTAAVEQQQEGPAAEGAMATTTNATLSNKIDNCAEEPKTPVATNKHNPNPWKVDNGPYWTGGANAEGDSDHDSAIYAELDKNSKEGHSDGGTPNSGHEELEAPPSYAVQLKPNDKNEDVYTHV